MGDLQGELPRTVLIILLVLLGAFHLAAHEPDFDSPPPANAVLFQLKSLSLLLGGQSWMVEFTVEYQRAFGNYLILSLMPELSVGTYENELGALLGLIVHPFGGRLRGLYCGAYPGFTYISNSTYFVAQIEVGYQWVLDHNIVVSLGVGARHDGRTGINRAGSFKIGFAF